MFRLARALQTIDPAKVSVFTLRANGRRTSVRLHRLERELLLAIAAEEGISVGAFAEAAGKRFGLGNRSANLRLALLAYCLERLPSAYGGWPTGSTRRAQQDSEQ